MKIVMIHGQNHKGNTWNTANVLVNAISCEKEVRQCCGIPLEDESTSKEPDGAFNEDYCKWCYTDGKFTYTSIDVLTDFIVEHFSNESFTPKQARAYCKSQLSLLKHWKIEEYHT